MQSHHVHATATPYCDTTPFASVEEAWFWFIQAYQARQDGAKITKGIGHASRPCEPVDILTIVDRLYRTRRLLIDHVRVMHFYGVRMFRPDPRRPLEHYAHKLWCEGMERLGEVLSNKGIVVYPNESIFGHE